MKYKITFEVENPTITNLDEILKDMSKEEYEKKVAPLIGKEIVKWLLSKSDKEELLSCKVELSE